VSTISKINAKVLVVDDEPFHRIVTSRMLNRRYSEVLVAENGEEAIQKVCNQFFHKVFMDLNMPVKDGWEATKEIHEKYPFLPIFAYSSDCPEKNDSSPEAEEFRQRLKENGFSGGIKKPLETDKFLQFCSEIESLSPTENSTAN